ncbi:hypothetical protein B0H13DRAFT_2357455 [Mycena leptocephala]|nr:hypothetical protein B0H13DRAFT_2357455 [Mycena leptocephala]
MPPGRLPLDPDIKAEHRRQTLARYAAKNCETLRDSARERMKCLRASHTSEASEKSASKHRRRALAAAARYRERHRDGIHEKDRLRRATALIAKEGTEAFNEKVERPYMRKTQQRHEGRPPPRKPRTENVTANQKRCRALRACGFEEDNGDDSDEDLAPGMCGCDLTECQKMHKNETDDRRAWKIFHVKYAKELDELTY